MKSFRDYLGLSNSCSYDVDNVIGRADRFGFQNFCSPAQISNELKFDVNFVNLTQMIFKSHSSSYWPKVGVGDIEKFKFLTSWQGPRTKKPF